MKAKVLSVQPNKTFTKRDGNGTYTALSVITQGQPYKGQVKDPREHRIFSSNPLYDALSKLKPGQWIDYKCDNSRFKNMESFEIISEAEGTNTNPSTASESFSKDFGNDNKSKEIARAVAIKAAVDTIASMVGAGMIKKTAKPDYVATEVLNMSTFFEQYLTFQEAKNEEQVIEEEVLGGDDLED